MVHMYMYILCANRGCEQSMDYAAQSTEPRLCGQSMDCLLNPYITQNEGTELGFGKSSDTDIRHTAGCFE